ncbi:MAG TPA: hypothetical protein VFZ89_11035 [Solirubrobacteraceae bacterium]
MADAALAFGIVYAVNLLPAFGPPTWAVLVSLRLSLDLSAVALVASGAVGAASGRATLAFGARSLRGHLSARRRENLDVLRSSIEERRAGAIGALGLFALSPVPSAQLFIAAGVTGAPILPLTGAFFAGRTVSYVVYVSAAQAVNESLGGTLLDTLRSPTGIAVQMVALLALVALMRVDWRRRLRGSVDDREGNREVDGDGEEILRHGRERPGAKGGVLAEVPEQRRQRHRHDGRDRAARE